MLLKHCLEQGLSKAELADDPPLDSDGPAGPGSDGAGRRAPVARKLDPCKGIVAARLAELTAQRLYEEVRAAGYEGGCGRVREHVRTVRPREAADPVVRFATPPGRQGQVDFATFRVPWERRHALVVLGHSRPLWLRFCPRQTMALLRDGLENAFETFGGVPEELLFDQMRAVVVSDDRLAGGGLELNAEFLRFAAHWGFRVRSCRPCRARTKGKVERPIRYVRESFFHGREFGGDEDLNEQAERWRAGTANERRHGTNGRLCSSLASVPCRRVGERPRPPDPSPAAAPVVAVERRPLREYAEAVR